MKNLFNVSRRRQKWNARCPVMTVVATSKDAARSNVQLIHIACSVALRR